MGKIKTCGSLHACSKRHTVKCSWTINRLIKGTSISTGFTFCILLNCYNYFFTMHNPKCHNIYCQLLAIITQNKIWKDQNSLPLVFFQKPITVNR